MKLPAKVREAVFARDGRVCAKCGTTERLTIDHRVPVSRGGTDDMENLGVLCLPCNARKRDGDPELFFAPDSPEVAAALEKVRRVVAERAAASTEYVVALVDAADRGHSYGDIGRAAGVARQTVRTVVSRARRVN